MDRENVKDTVPALDANMVTIVGVLVMMLLQFLKEVMKPRCICVEKI